MEPIDDVLKIIQKNYTLVEMGFDNKDDEWIKDLGWVKVVVKDKKLLARPCDQPGEFVDIDTGIRQLKEITRKLKGASIIT